MGNESSSAASRTGAAPPQRARPVLHPLYKVRVAIKGDRSVGKSSVLRMLQGGAFREAYEPTLVTCATEVDWTFKSTMEQVRLEAVEPAELAPAARKPASQELKLAFDAPAQRGGDDEPDAARDVVKGAHALLLVFDPRKSWTYDYVKRELALHAGNAGLDVLVLANFRDAAPSWQISSADAVAALRDYPAVRYLECCAKDGYGKTQVLNFFNLPFLRQQRQHLETLLQRNREDTAIALEEFDMVSKEQNYASHLTWATAEPLTASAKARLQQPAAAAAPTAVASPAAASAARAPPAPSPARAPRAATAAADVAEDDLDGFLVEPGGDDDGWGKTIASSGDEADASDDEQSAPRARATVTTPQQQKPVPVMLPQQAPPSAARVATAPVSVLVAASKGVDGGGGSDDDDDLEGFLDRNTPLDTTVTLPVQQTSTPAAPPPEAAPAPPVAKPSADALASVLEAARAMAEQQAREARDAAAAAESVAKKPPRTGKKGAGKKKKKASSTSSAEEAPAARSRGEYTAL